IATLDTDTPKVLRAGGARQCAERGIVSAASVDHKGRMGSKPNPARQLPTPDPQLPSPEHKAQSPTPKSLGRNRDSWELVVSWLVVGSWAFPSAIRPRCASRRTTGTRKRR